MKQLYKSPRGSNKFSGNVSLSYEEFEQIKSGECASIRVEGKDFDFSKDIEPWMIEHAVDKDDYILLPYSEKSFLVKGRYND
jgi:hypothetical protein